MAFWFNLMSVSFSLLYTPFLMFLLGTIFLASMGKSFGVRRLYIKILIKIFEVNYTKNIVVKLNVMKRTQP